MLISIQAKWKEGGIILFPHSIGLRRRRMFNSQKLKRKDLENALLWYFISALNKMKIA